MSNINLGHSHFSKALVCPTLGSPFWLVALSTAFAFGISTSTVIAHAQTVELQRTIGSWSLYCAKERTSSAKDCSLVNSTLSATDNSRWLKIGVSFSDSQTQPLLTIVTPVIRYIKSGLSFSVDGIQKRLLSIDYCGEASCESDLPIDESLVKDLNKSKQIGVEYQTNNDTGIRMLVDSSDFGNALDILTSAVKRPHQFLNSNFNVEETKTQDDKDSEISLLKVELRSDPASKEFADRWQSVSALETCFGAPSSKEVKVTGKDIVVNRDDLSQWLNATEKCSRSSVFWVKPDQPSPRSRSLNESATLDPTLLHRIALYNFLAKKKLNVVMTDSTGIIPLRNGKEDIGGLLKSSVSKNVETQLLRSQPSH